MSPTVHSADRPMSLWEWGMLAALSGLWGGSFFFNAVAVGGLPVLTVVAVRVALGALMLVAVLRLAGQRLPAGVRVWTAFFAISLVNNAVPFSLIVWGQQHVASGVASILNASTPLFTVILAHVFTADERITGGRLVGVVVGFAGVAVMIGANALATTGAGFAAQLACLAAAMSYALAAIFGRRFRRLGVAPIAAAAGQLTAASVVLVPLMLAVDRPWTLPLPGFEVVGALLGLAAASTALAYVLYFRLLATAGAANISLVTFLVPMSAILLGILFLGESLLPRHVAGIALIGLGLGAIDGRPWRALRHRAGLTRAGGAC